jgi:hypothetical protein
LRRQGVAVHSSDVTVMHYRPGTFNLTPMANSHFPGYTTMSPNLVEGTEFRQILIAVSCLIFYKVVISVR